MQEKKPPPLKTAIENLVREAHDSPEAALSFLRDEMGLPAKKIAEMAGIKPQVLCDIKGGRREMHERLLDWLGWERVTIIRRKQTQ